MKKIVFIILFTLTLFGNTNPCKLDVYFGNGVDNDSKEAEASMEKLKQFMQLNYPSRFKTADEGVTYNFKYAHNETYGVINDLIETHWQLYESGQIGQLYFSFVASALDSVDNTNMDNNAYLKRVQNIINQYELDTVAMLNRYRINSFNSKHNVLLIAHSQGNLFGNKMYEILNSDEKDKFAMVSIATPANAVAKGGGYTTLHNDWVIKGIPNSLPSNADGSGHSFIESYLNNPIFSSVETIALNIKSAVNTLDENSCVAYRYFRLIGYICHSRIDQELEVDIYGTKENYSEELVATDTKIRVALNSDGKCPLTKDDFTTGIPKYDKGSCMAYRVDDTSYQPLEHILNKKYESLFTCSTYEMNPVVAEQLKGLQK